MVQLALRWTTRHAVLETRGPAMIQWHGSGFGGSSTTDSISSDAEKIGLCLRRLTKLGYRAELLMNGLEPWSDGIGNICLVVVIGKVVIRCYAVCYL
jgi:hypothetical protein